MRLLLAAVAALGLAACSQPDATVDGQTAVTADPAAATNSDAGADAVAAAAAADASKVTSLDEVGP